MTNNLDTSFSWESCLVVTLKNKNLQEVKLIELPQGNYDVWFISDDDKQEEYAGVMNNSHLCQELKRAKLGGRPRDKYFVSLAKSKQKTYKP